MERGWNATHNDVYTLYKLAKLHTLDPNCYLNREESLAPAATLWTLLLLSLGFSLRLCLETIHLANNLGCFCRWSLSLLLRVKFRWRYDHFYSVRSIGMVLEVVECLRMQIYLLPQFRVSPVCPLIDSLELNLLAVVVPCTEGSQLMSNRLWRVLAICVSVGGVRGMSPVETGSGMECSCPVLCVVVLLHLVLTLL